RVPKLYQVLRHSTGAPVVVDINITDGTLAGRTAHNDNRHLQIGKCLGEMCAQPGGNDNQPAHASLMAKIDAFSDIIKVLRKAVKQRDMVVRPGQHLLDPLQNVSEINRANQPLK